MPQQGLCSERAHTHTVNIQAPAFGAGAWAYLTTTTAAYNSIPYCEDGTKHASGSILIAFTLMIAENRTKGRDIMANVVANLIDNMMDKMIK